RMFAARGAGFTVTAHTDLKTVLDGASYVFTTFRPGGMEGRHLDESIPLRHGVVGQETAGPGGFLMACRSIPVLMEIAALAGKDAWIVNYTNPTNVVTDAVTRYSDAKIIGLCDQHVGDTEMWAELLGLPFERLEADWIGLNHATWAERLRLDGEQLDLPTLLDDLEIPG
ncbi:glycoside hydrolase family 4, partial [Actinomadura adrarensis]